MKKILVGVDNSPRTSSVLAAATELASRLGAKLTFFRAVTIPTEPIPADYQSDPDDYATMLERRAREQVAAATRDIAPALVDRIHVELGVPWEAICKAAREDDVACIVIGSHGYGGIDRLLGTTAAKVVNHADRSVMVVRSGEKLAA